MYEEIGEVCHGITFLGLFHILSSSRFVCYNPSMIYLDYAATSPVDQRVLDAMMPYFREAYGNPLLYIGIAKAGNRMDQRGEGRFGVALNREIIFTSCGSEADNLALRGAAMAKARRLR